jgi:hypothetical protein
VVSFTSLPLHPRTYCIGGWVGPRVNLEAVEYRKNIFPLPGTEPRPSSPQPVSILSELFRLRLDWPVLNRIRSGLGRVINCGKDCRVWAVTRPSNNALQPLPRYPTRMPEVRSIKTACTCWPFLSHRTRMNRDGDTIIVQWYRHKQNITSRRQ